MNTHARETPAEQKPNVGKIVLLGIVLVVATMVGLAAALFALAGRMDWVAPWVLCGAYGIAVTSNLLVLYKVNPEVIVLRLRGRGKACTWDKVLAATMSIFWLGGIAVAGLDNRYGWSPSLSEWVRAVAAVFFFTGDLIFLWAMSVNKFFDKMVRIQSDRGHVPITTGPYRYVRHPGYIGWTLMTMTPVVILGSLWALIPTSVAVICMIIRTVLEDRVLHRELAGYSDYAARVRYRLLPGVW